MQIEFVALGFSLGEELRYQYKLEGAREDWSAPTEGRTINFARLAPGAYRFLVRAINSDGAVSETPASFSFTIPPPVWQRLWFLALVTLAVALIAYTIYRIRVRRILEVANMRTRIATDLHDDIGANLTRIALLSEVAKQLGENGKAEGSLSSIARISRESVASMSDIIWAISPDRDSLLDLTRKMRQHAEEIFTSRDIELDFIAPTAERLKLGASVRRDFLLIFKEAVNNAARHARCSRVRIVFRVEHSSLSLTVTDDGAGFDTSIESDGQGLTSMRRRAASLGGEIEIDSRAGQGTTVNLRVPFARATYLLR